MATYVIKDSAGLYYAHDTDAPELKELGQYEGFVKEQKKAYRFYENFMGTNYSAITWARDTAKLLGGNCRVVKLVPRACK